MGENTAELIGSQGAGGLTAKILPEYVRIGTHIYHILFPYRFKESRDFSGQCDFDLLEIRISNIDANGHPRPLSKIYETFWHEIMHAIDYEYTDYSISDKFDEGYETIVALLGRGVFQVLSDNFMLLKLPDKRSEVSKTSDNNNQQFFSGVARNPNDAIFMNTFNDMKFEEKRTHTRLS